MEPLSLPASVTDPVAYAAYVDQVTGRRLPKLIDEPGWYETRRGFRVHIQEVRVPGPSSNCAGTAYPPPRRGRLFRRPVWSSWQSTGRFVFLGEHPWDIVKKLGGQQ